MSTGKTLPLHWLTKPIERLTLYIAPTSLRGKIAILLNMPSVEILPPGLREIYFRETNETGLGMAPALDNRVIDNQEYREQNQAGNYFK